MTPNNAAKLAFILGLLGKAIEAVEISQRLDALERRRGGDYPQVGGNELVIYMRPDDGSP